MRVYQATKIMEEGLVKIVLDPVLDQDDRAIDQDDRANKSCPIICVFARSYDR